MLSKPKKIPEKAFYYHYKHDPKGKVENYAYEVVGVGLHTEDDAREIDKYMVVYRPLYPEALVYKTGKIFYLRPLSMFMESITKDGKTFPRFKKIKDLKTIQKLQKIRNKMYK